MGLGCFCRFSPFASVSFHTLTPLSVPLIKPCMQFSRTRLPDRFHLKHSRQPRLALRYCFRRRPRTLLLITHLCLRYHLQILAQSVCTPTFVNLSEFVSMLPVLTPTASHGACCHYFPCDFRLRTSLTVSPAVSAYQGLPCSLSLLPAY
jgi:hypothetical protein